MAVLIRVLILAACVFALGAIQTASAQSVTIGNVEFTVRSATIAGQLPNLRFIMAITNKNAGPVGIFVYARETSIAIDSGISYSGNSIVANSGVGKCGGSYERDYCSNNKSSMLTTIPSGISDNVILEFQGPGTDEGRKQARAAQLADFSGMIYLQSSDGNGNYVPLPFSDIPVRNTIK